MDVDAQRVVTGCESVGCVDFELQAFDGCGSGQVLIVVDVQYGVGDVP